MPRKDPFKQPGAVKFQLVHRSQRDPLIHDPEASQNILKPLGDKKILDHDATKPFTDGPSKSKPAVDASQYGIFYDDTQYDYLQHLRPIGEKEDNVESILLEVPATSSKGKKKPIIMTLKDTTEAANIPDEFLPPKVELPKNYETQRNIPTSIAGFRPDMNPHLRQTLEALEEDAFVDDGLEDDFFAELVKDGEVAAEEELDFPFEEQGVDLDAANGEGDELEEGDENWEARFRKFKRSQPRGDDVASERDHLASEGGDTVGTLPAMSVLGIRKRRRKAGSEASGYTMSSSSMFRNQGLSTLDEQFDKVLEKDYDEAHDEDCDCSDCENGAGPTSEDDDSDAPDLLTSRDDFEGLLDEFLNEVEIIGTQLKPVLEGVTGEDKMDTLRKAMVGATLDEEEETKRTIKRLVKMQSRVDDELVDDEEAEDPKDRWDCETILSTYSNLENHPRVIRVRDSRKVAKIRLDSKTGLPVVEEENENGMSASRKKAVIPRKLAMDRTLLHDASHKTVPDSKSTPIVRPKNETKEEKAARKHAVKAEKQARRVEKKTMKETFAGERQREVRAQLGKQLGGVGLKKL